MYVYACVHVSCNKKLLCIACGIRRIGNRNQRLHRPIQMCSLNGAESESVKSKFALSCNRTSEMNSQLTAVAAAFIFTHSLICSFPSEICFHIFSNNSFLCMSSVKHFLFLSIKFVSKKKRHKNSLSIN